MSTDDQSLRALDTVAQRLRDGVDYWAILGVQRDSSPQEIALAHRQLCVLLHPDRAVFRGNVAKKDIDRAFQAVSNAFNTLSNPAKQKIYKESLLQQQMGRGSVQKGGTVDVQRQIDNINRMMRKRAWSDAEKAIHRMRRELPGQRRSELELLLGWAVFNNPEHDDANRLQACTTVWQRVVEREGSGRTYAQACYYLALAARKSKQISAAIEWVDRCLRSNDGHVDARRLQRLLQREPPTPTSGAPGGTLSDTFVRGKRLVRGLFKRGGKAG
jgi:hypothetical protein